MAHAVVVGLGFGDEGKGTTVDWLCATRDISAVIRYNGGPQAAHNVVTDDGLHHTFAQFGSGTLRGVPTFLSKHMLVNPFNIVKEADHLIELGVADPYGLLHISEDALLVTPYHVDANRMRERNRGVLRHGSTGQGVGEARSYALDVANGGAAPKMGEISNDKLMLRKLTRMHEFYASQDLVDPDAPSPDDLVDMYQSVIEQMTIVPDAYYQIFCNDGDCVFEGAQGVLLDEKYGFFPNTTWTDTTPHNALKMIGSQNREIIGVTRTYQTRHGDGPMPTEDDVFRLEAHNAFGEFQGGWRTGTLDMVLLNYGIRLAQPDSLMLTHCDYPLMNSHVAMKYSLLDDLRLGVPRSIQDAAKLTRLLGAVTPVNTRVFDEQDVINGIVITTGMRPKYLSYGPTAKDKVYADVRSVR